MGAHNISMCLERTEITGDKNIPRGLTRRPQSRYRHKSRIPLITRSCITQYGTQHGYYKGAAQRSDWLTLKRKCLHFDEIFITGCTGSCQNDNFQCSQWLKFRQNDDIFVSVNARTENHNTMTALSSYSVIAVRRRTKKPTGYRPPEPILFNVCKVVGLCILCEMINDITVTVVAVGPGAYLAPRHQQQYTPQYCKLWERLDQSQPYNPRTLYDKTLRAP